jgi:hypothetical protein
MPAIISGVHGANKAELRSRSICNLFFGNTWKLELMLTISYGVYKAI